MSQLSWADESDTKKKKKSAVKFQLNDTPIHSNNRVACMSLTGKKSEDESKVEKPKEWKEIKTTKKQRKQKCWFWLECRAWAHTDEAGKLWPYCEACYKEIEEPCKEDGCNAMCKLSSRKRGKCHRRCVEHRKTSDENKDKKLEAKLEVKDEQTVLPQVPELVITVTCDIPVDVEIVSK